MKRAILLLISIVFLWSLKAQDNPYEKYGYKPKIVTMSGGKYQEFHDRDTIVRIGNLVYNTKSKKLIGFELEDTLVTEATLAVDVVSRWLSPDPLKHKFPSWSPYNYANDNPIRFIDPDGRAAVSFNSPDDITVNDAGEVTNVVRNDQPNRFFDKNGNQFNFNDINNADNSQNTTTYNVGDRVYNNVSSTELSSGLYSTGLKPTFFNAFNKRVTAGLFAAYESYDGADFAFSFLGKNYDVSNKELSDGANRTESFNKGSYFKFEGGNTLYNLFDAGNYMWGARMKLSGFTSSEIFVGSQANSLLFGGSFDSEADQNAIYDGFKSQEPIMK